jgi:hypothetical protein
MSKPHFIELAELIKEKHDNPAVWTLNILMDRVRKKFPYTLYLFPDEPTLDHDFLLVIGGGQLMDYAKVWRRKNKPSMHLAVIPSIWGSGAENSKVAIINSGDEKVIYNNEECLPDTRSIWPEITEGIPEALVMYACGDTWVHALEGFLSPLADDKLKVELAGLIRHLTNLKIGNDPMWFELSAETCAGQARSSVGFIHGLAHTLEPILKKKHESEVFGHARLCSLYSWPVFRMNRTHSDKLEKLFGKYNLNVDSVGEKLRLLFIPEDFNRLLPLVEENWMKILRHPFTRTNFVLVRPGDYQRFCEAGRS